MLFKIDAYLLNTYQSTRTKALFNIIKNNLKTNPESEFHANKISVVLYIQKKALPRKFIGKLQQM